MISKTESIDPQIFKAQRHRVSLAMSGFTLPMMRAIYQVFDGDLVMAMVLGEIGTRNVSAWLLTDSNDASLLDYMQHHEKVLRPCNALSIAEATGIPRETARRKIESLIERGWIYRSENGYLFVHPSVPDSFDLMTADMAASLLVAAKRIEELTSNTAS